MYVLAYIAVLVALYVVFIGYGVPAAGRVAVAGLWAGVCAPAMAYGTYLRSGLADRRAKASSRAHALAPGNAWSRRQTLTQAADEAIALRGCAAVSTVGDSHRWCAISASVRGELELKVAPPPVGFLARDSERLHRWLRENDFVEVYDAWARPLPPGTSSAACVAILEAALEHGVDVRANEPLEQTLIHPGVRDPGAAIPADAPYGEHIRASLETLVAARRGKGSIFCGRPSQVLGWGFAEADGLHVTPDVDPEADPWHFELTDEGAAQAASRLVALMNDHASLDDPLFITLMDLEAAADVRAVPQAVDGHG